MKSKTCHRAMLLLVLMFCCFYSEAQRADSATYRADKIYYWGGFHLGFGSYFINTGLDAGALFKNTIVIAAKTDVNANLRIFGPPLEHNEARETALMLGLKLTHNRYSNWIVMSGISAVTMKDRGEVIGNNPGYFGGNVYADDINYHVTGIPVVAKLTVTPANMFAMDFAASVNINPHRTFFGLTFGVAFGSVRSGQPKDPPPGRQRPGVLPRFPKPLLPRQKNLDIKT